MFHPESNPLAPKPSGPKKPEKELVRVWLGDAAAAEMDDEKPETEDEDSIIHPSLIEQEKKTLWEMKRPDEVTLTNVPAWKELPDVETFKKDFKFQDVLDGYREGLPLSDFTPRPEETLPSFQGIETLLHAKVFDIEDVIAKARKKDPKHSDRLTTSEVLKAIDKAGYRPATLEELLAYARDYWKPDANPETLTEAERELQNTQALSIIGLSSVSTGSHDRRYVSELHWSGRRRELNAYGIGSVWNAHDRFLVLRKAFPS